MRAIHTRLDRPTHIDDPWGDRLVLDSERAAFGSEAGLPPMLHFVPTDLSCEQLATALTRSPYRRAEPAFFSWLGVTVYLTREANLATFRGIAACAAAGSELVFTYVDQRELDVGSQSIRDLRSRTAALGEPWLSGFNPSQLAEDLRQVGLSLVEDFSGEHLWRRYCTEDEDALRSTAAVHIARAHVA